MAIVGIDLGTTTSEVAVFKNGAPLLIRTEQGDIVPSVVGIDEATRQPGVGAQMRTLKAQFPHLCVEQIKRKMGSFEKVPMGDNAYLPEEISAHILTYLKKAAEAHIGEPVDEAVITVPANFTNAARLATIRAGELAGLRVRRILNEPTAAALAYGHAESQYEERVLVYDLGGGTFDVSIVEYMGDAVDVLASAGDDKLGGKDFDEALLAHVANVFASQHGITVSPSTKMYYTLLFACEDAKKELSTRESTTIHLPLFADKDGAPVALTAEVTRQTFEALISPRIDQTERAIRKALKDAKVTPMQISRVLLVGGSTRIPYVKNLVKRVFDREPETRIDPDRAVALGAAVQAGILLGESHQIIMDVAPLSLGTSMVIEVADSYLPGRYSEIIPANWKVLVPKTESFATLYENQEAVDFKVYQRNALAASDWAEIEGQPSDGYTLLGERTISVPPGPAGQEIRVTYLYNQNGNIEIDLLVSGSGETVHFQVDSPLDSAGMIESRQRLDDMWQKSELYGGVRALLLTAEKELAKCEEGEHKQKLGSLIDRLKQALAKSESDAVKAVEVELTEYLFELS